MKELHSRKTEIVGRTRRRIGSLSAVGFMLCAYAGCADAVAPFVDPLDADAGATPPGSLVEPTRDADADAGADARADANEDVEPPSVPMCVGTECPYPYATCEGDGGASSGKCGVNLLDDNNNCGACGNVCPTKQVVDPSSKLQMTTRCVAGKCQRECSGFPQIQLPVDCNGFVEDGCEIDVLNDINNCGSCGNKCDDICYQGHCGCTFPDTFCPGVGCVNTRISVLHCGACGNACAIPDTPRPDHMYYGCVDGQCPTLFCEGGYGDCNGDQNDGCETRLNDTGNCGACGNACNDNQRCEVDIYSPSGVKCLCDPEGKDTRCINKYGNVACTNLQTDPDNCGACGRVCPGSTSAERDHINRYCREGFCDTQCFDGWGDCDGIASNGCETNLANSANHCGACGHACDVDGGQPCVEGQCLMVACDAGQGTPR